MVVLWTLIDDRGLSTLLASTSKASEGFQVGHSEGDDSHEGPYLHSVESTSCSVVSPRVTRSAGLQAVGQYLQLDEMSRISFTLCLMNGFRFFLLWSQKELSGYQTSKRCPLYG